MNETLFSNKLIQLLQTFSVTERRKLLLFLDAPYFFRKKTALQLTQLAISHIEDGIKAGSAQAGKVMGMRVYSEKRLRHAVSETLTAVQDFLYFEEVRQQLPGYAEYCFLAYRRRALDAQMHDVAVLLRKQLENPDVMEPAQELRAARANELLQAMADQSHKSFTKYQSQTRSNRPDQYDFFYVLQKLRQIAEAINERAVYQSDRLIFMESEIWQLTQQNTFQEHALIRVYTKLIHALQSRHDTHFEAFVSEFSKHRNLSAEIAAELHTYGTNFCIAKINAGEQAYHIRLFQWYAEGLKQGVLLQENRLDPRNFKNIVAIALRCGKLQWVEYFISTYKKYLPAIDRENAVNYNWAQYHFFQKDYNKSLRALQSVALNDTFYGLDARTLTLKCFYELDEKEAFLNSYYSFRQFVNRKKLVSVNHRRNYLNLLRFAKALFNLRPGDNARLAKIKKDVAAAAQIADKRWILEKLSQFQ
ncbi:MAG: hypothetical protein U0T84_00910 [Chitinophagales bacterium]